MAKMVSEGRLKYAARIAEYWPEFAQNGKEDITVADLMRHEAGLWLFHKQVDKYDLTTEALKENRMGKIIEVDQPEWVTEAKKNDKSARERKYHACTRDYVANEIFRRVHPDGYTMGEYLRHLYAADPNLSIHCGVREENTDVTSRLRKERSIGLK